jgi:deoxyadenosine/deoxycytidine kinase
MVVTPRTGKLQVKALLQGLNKLFKLNNNRMPEKINADLIMKEELTKSKINLKNSEMKGNNKPFIVSIEGNIGSGKSTMLNYFNKFTDVELIPEPVKDWCDVNGHNLLGKMYEDPKRWSFQFQSYVQLSRLKLLKEPTDCSVKIIERSLQNNRFCFLENHRKEETLVSAELNVLYTWFSFLQTNMDINLDLIVYLKTSPEVAYERLKKRGRKEESGVPMDFIKHLHQCYEDWLLDEKFGSPPAPVLVLDADQGIEDMLKIYEQYTDEIRGLKPVDKSQLYCKELTAAV